MKTRYLLSAVLLIGCTGMQRDCSSCMAENTGADWVVVQLSMSGEPFDCWKLHDVGITNEEHSDGIYWRESSGHLVHISGWYNRVQVQNGDYAAAANSVGVDLSRCTDGRYAPLPAAKTAQ